MFNTRADFYDILKRRGSFFNSTRVTPFNFVTKLIFARVSCGLETGNHGLPTRKSQFDFTIRNGFQRTTRNSRQFRNNS